MLTQETQIDLVMRTLWDSRSIRPPRTDDEWEAVKRSPIFRGTLRAIRSEAVALIDAGEFA